MDATEEIKYMKILFLYQTMMYTNVIEIHYAIKARLPRIKTPKKGNRRKHAS